ncbi:MAG: hypothetical protein QXJ17_07975 [Nitrososphaeria archaeon]
MRKRKSIIRTIESFASILIILSAFVIAYYLVIPENAYIVRLQSDLNKQGYNMLQAVTLNNALDNIIFDANGNVKQGWEMQFKVLFDSMIPQGLIYNVTVYKVMRTTTSENWVQLQPFNTVKISNTDSEDTFLKSAEVVLVTYFYTSKVQTAISPTEKGLCTLLFYLRLAKLGGV